MGQPISGIITVALTAVVAMFTLRTEAQNCTSSRKPSGSRQKCLKYLEAHHHDIPSSRAWPPQDPVGSRLDKWIVAKMTLHCGADKVVITLMRLRWIAYNKTEDAVEIYWDGFGPGERLQM
jgi:hypothetical protein